MQTKYMIHTQFNSKTQGYRMKTYYTLINIYYFYQHWTNSNMSDLIKHLILDKKESR